MKKLTKLLANRRLPGEHSLHRRAAARHAAVNNREPDITEVISNDAVLLNFYRASICEGGLGSRNSVRPSVRLSVCLSVCHTRGLWQNYMTHCRYFDTTRKGNHSATLIPTVVGRRRPLPSEICAQSDPPPRKNPDFDRFPSITSQP